MGGKRKLSKGTGLAPVTVRSPRFLTNGTDEAFRRLINNLHSIGAFFGKVSTKLAAVMDLPASQHHILRVISELGSQDSINVNRVADILHMNPTQVTRELNDLVRLKLVRKTPSRNDRRQVLLTVTDDGMQILEEIAPVLQEINEALFGGLSRKDFENLCSVAKALTENVEDALRVADWLTARRRTSKQSEESKPVRP